MAKPKLLKMTAGEIRVAMSKKWAAPEYAIMWEVAEATASNSRYADAVIASLWPSRGLELHGVEIKVSRSDFKREAADPKKAETIGRFCDRWYLHTPKGLVEDLVDVPPAWGLREFDGAAWKTIREAEKTHAEPVTRGFLMAMLRRADGTMRSLIDEGVREARRRAEEIEADRRAKFGTLVQEAADRRLGSLAAIEESIGEFKRAFGDDVFDRYLDMGRLGVASRALVDLARGRQWIEFDKFERRLREAADALAETRKILDFVDGKVDAETLTEKDSTT